jgi:hypothetical protein
MRGCARARLGACVGDCVRARVQDHDSSSQQQVISQRSPAEGQCEDEACHPQQRGLHKRLLHNHDTAARHDRAGQGSRQAGQ